LLRMIQFGVYRFEGLMRQLGKMNERVKAFLEAFRRRVKAEEAFDVGDLIRERFKRNKRGEDGDVVENLLSRKGGLALSLFLVFFKSANLFLVCFFY
jgi:hypothetical protein